MLKFVSRCKPYNKRIKRILDLTIAVPTFIILSPLLIIIAILIRIKLGSPVLFSQQRPGLHGKPFTIYKFRTMTDERDKEGNMLPDRERMISMGNFLRMNSMDELPELFNVIKGDMSFVGPRPLLMDYLKLYTPEQMRRHEVKPGITGWAQINGRNAITWEKKFKYDVWYVDNLSLWIDVKILIKSIVNIVNREGINQPGHATMGKFKGNYQ
jgi:lipopolysaccharide/colanic/teichoic acid biosynthesis glycosyltransferase